MIPWNDENLEAIDATVTHALSVLAQATPPAGMETRILTHLHQNSETGPSTFAHRITQRNFQLTLAGTLVFTCLLAAIIVRPDHRQPAAPPLATAAVPPSPPRIHFAPVNQATPEIPTAPRSIHPVHSAAKVHLVSFPAPPEPLTEQERLLLAVAASHPSPDIVAALDPVQRAETTARSEQQFLASLKVNNPNASIISGDPQ